MLVIIYQEIMDHEPQRLSSLIMYTNLSLTHIISSVDLRILNQNL